MTTEVTLEFELDYPPEPVWEFISDHEQRAKAISVVEDYDSGPGDKRATWHIALPIPLVRSTIEVDTKEVERKEPEYVRFTGRSKAMSIVGEHTLEETEDGCTLTNEFTVDGKLPGVETFFKKNLEPELRNLEAELHDYLGE